MIFHYIKCEKIKMLHHFKSLANVDNAPACLVKVRATILWHVVQPFLPYFHIKQQFSYFRYFYFPLFRRQQMKKAQWIPLWFCW